MGIVYTARISHTGPGLVLDTTIKSGAGLGKVLQPSWEIVMGHKRGQISDEEYVEKYLAMLRQRYAADRQPFLDILAHEQVTLLCYCRAGKFCHRHLAADVLIKIATAFDLPFEYRGEIR